MAVLPKYDQPIKVAKANAMSEMPSRRRPYGKMEKAFAVSPVILVFWLESGKCNIWETMAMPVIKHITTVSQKVAVMETRACLWGDWV